MNNCVSYAWWRRDTTAISQRSKQFQVASETFWVEWSWKECSHLLLSLHNKSGRRCGCLTVRIWRWCWPPTVYDFSWSSSRSRRPPRFYTWTITGPVSFVQLSRHAATTGIEYLPILRFERSEENYIISFFGKVDNLFTFTRETDNFIFEKIG